MFKSFLTVAILALSSMPAFALNQNDMDISRAYEVYENGQIQDYIAWSPVYIEETDDVAFFVCDEEMCATVRKHLGENVWLDKIPATNFIETF